MVDDQNAATVARVETQLLEAHVKAPLLNSEFVEETDMTPPYYALAAWELLFLATFAASTAGSGGAGRRLLFRTVGGLSVLYLVLMAHGDAVGAGLQCAAGKTPEYGFLTFFTPTCFPQDWANSDSLQMKVHLAACVLLIWAFWHTMRIWKHRRLSQSRQG